MFPIGRTVTQRTRSLLLTAVPRTMGSKNSKKDSNMDKVEERPVPAVYNSGEEPKPEVTFTEEELRAKLSAEEYKVTQERGILNAVVRCLILTRGNKLYLIPRE